MDHIARRFPVDRWRHGIASTPKVLLPAQPPKRTAVRAGHHWTIKKKKKKESKVWPTGSTVGFRSKWKGLDSWWFHSSSSTMSSKYWSWLVRRPGLLLFTTGGWLGSLELFVCCPKPGVKELSGTVSYSTYLNQMPALMQVSLTWVEWFCNVVIGTKAHF